MHKAAGQLSERVWSKFATQFDIHATIPKFVNWLAIPTRTVNHDSVSHAVFSFKQSSQSRTPVRRRIESPSIAATTLEIPSASLQTNHQTQKPRNNSTLVSKITEILLVPLLLITKLLS